jgi:DNA-binding transcriptional MerR regulator
MTKEEPQAEQRYGIGAVAKLTGLSDHTIRVWERRYQAVIAGRAANGRREYTAANVEKLGLLKRLTDAGVSISRIAADGIDELRQRAASMSVLSQAPATGTISAAVLGEYLASRLGTGDQDLAPLELVVVDTDRDRFAADLHRHTPDVVVIETPILNREAIEQLESLVRRCGARGGVLVFSFANSRDVEHARQAGFVVLRAPVDVEELRAAAVRSLAAPSLTTPANAAAEAGDTDADWRFTGQVAPRRFTQQQLARLANASTAIDCECPQHLAELVRDLSAFEVYSAQCANRDDEDAALHSYLHQTTAQARALIEVALEKVVKAEGIQV